MSYSICIKCPILHYENCGICFGFGVYRGTHKDFVPITAATAMEGTYPDDWMACPECESTPKGLPIRVAKRLLEVEASDCQPLIDRVKQRLAKDQEGEA